MSQHQHDTIRYQHPVIQSSSSSTSHYELIVDKLIINTRLSRLSIVVKMRMSMSDEPIWSITSYKWSSFNYITWCSRCADRATSYRWSSSMSSSSRSVRLSEMSMSDEVQQWASSVHQTTNSPPWEDEFTMSQTGMREWAAMSPAWGHEPWAMSHYRLPGNERCMNEKRWEKSVNVSAIIYNRSPAVIQHE